MGWQVGWDDNWGRWVGYGVPAKCDHPGCGAGIDRGLARVCGSDVFGGEDGCGLFFCGDHMSMVEVPSEIMTSGTRCTKLCERCEVAHMDDFERFEPFEPTPDVDEWTRHLLTDESWGEWRAANPDEVERLKPQLC